MFEKLDSSQDGILLLNSDVAKSILLISIRLDASQDDILLLNSDA